MAASVRDPFAPLLALPGVAAAVEEVRDAVARLARHPVQRRHQGDLLAAARGRIVLATAAHESSADSATSALAAAARAQAAGEQYAALRPPLPQLLALLHTAAHGDSPSATGEAAPVGRPHLSPEGPLEAANPDASRAQSPRVAPLPVHEPAAPALAALAHAVAASAAPALVLAAVVEAEVRRLSPFADLDTVVAQAAARSLLLTRAGDPSGAVTWQAVLWEEAADPARHQDLAAGYAAGGADAVRAWVLHWADAAIRGAELGRGLADRVVAGDLTVRALS